jgi:hypothetical protein
LKTGDEDGSCKEEKDENEKSREKGKESFQSLIEFDLSDKNKVVKFRLQIQILKFTRLFL